MENYNGNKGYDQYFKIKTILSPNKQYVMQTLKKSKIGLITAILAFLLIACDEGVNTYKLDVPDFTIAQIAEASANLNILVAALEKSELMATLEGDGVYTLFAPTDDSFVRYLAVNDYASLDDIPLEILKQILLNHMVIGENLSTDLSTGYKNSLSTSGYNNRNISLYIDNSVGVQINGTAKVIDGGADFRGTNGVVHIIDAVIDLPNIYDQVTANNDLTSFTSALNNNNNTIFSNFLSRQDLNFTLFAPLNSAFSSFTNPDDNNLNGVWANHIIVNTTFFSDDLQNSYVKTAANNEGKDLLSMYINTNGDSVTINGESKVVQYDIIGTNGVIHMVDLILDLPKTLDFIKADQENFSMLLDTFTSEGQQDLLSILSSTSGNSPSPFTVFAPTNEAFESLQTIPSGNELNLVLQHHIIPNYNIVTGDITNNQTSQATLEGDTLYFTLENGDISITDGSGNSNSNLILENIQAINGVIHAIDNVLIPNTLN